MTINSKAPITADQAIKLDKAPSRAMKGKAGCMGVSDRSGAEPLTVAKLRAIKKQLGMDNKRDSLMQDRGGVGTGQVRCCMEPTTHKYF